MTSDSGFIPSHTPSLCDQSQRRGLFCLPANFPARCCSDKFRPAFCDILNAVMEMTVYLDVLLISNLWVDYALLRAAARLTHTPLSPLRAVLASAAGAVSALAILLPAMPAAVCFAGRCLTAFAIAAAAFGMRSPRLLLRQTAVLFLLSLFFCGAVYALAMLRAPAGFLMQNTVVYADVSLLTLLIATTAAAAASVLWAKQRERLPKDGYRLHLRICGKDYSFPALADTGSVLRDVFSGKPVVVCPAHSLSKWLAQYPDSQSAAAACRGFRMIPVQTVAGSCLLPAFLPDYAAILQTGQRTEIPLDILIAVTAEQTPVIVPAGCIHE